MIASLWSREHARGLLPRSLLPALFIMALNHNTRGDLRMTTLATSDSNEPEILYDESSRHS